MKDDREYLRVWSNDPYSRKPRSGNGRVDNRRNGTGDKKEDGRPQIGVWYSESQLKVMRERGLI